MRSCGEGAFVARELAPAGLRSGPKKRDSCAVQREQAPSPQVDSAEPFMALLQTLRPGLGHLRILFGLDPGHADRADHLAVVNNRHATFKGRQQRRR